MFSNKQNKTSQNTVQAKIVVRESKEDRGAELLKEATRLKKQGDLDDAIAVLYAAYVQLAKSDTDYTIDVFLRLPMYLQAAGRSPEAWEEFNNLLTCGYPNMTISDSSWHVMESRVHDKMRLFLQRENKSQMAIHHGVLSYITYLRSAHEGLPSDINLEYISRSISDDSIRTLLEPLLKKAGQLNQLGSAVAVVHEWANALPNTDDQKFEKRLAELTNH